MYVCMYGNELTYFTELATVAWKTWTFIIDTIAMRDTSSAGRTRIACTRLTTLTHIHKTQTTQTSMLSI